MKIYTKKGDKGTTSLLGGTRVSKAHLRLEAYGTIDELNSYLGVLRDSAQAYMDISLIPRIQNNLFTIGSILANDATSQFPLPNITSNDVEELEASIDEMEKELEPLRNFILPGGHIVNSFAHVARCICRRAERNVVRLSQEVEVDELALAYLNRLSDWLFVFARYASKKTNSPEIIWKTRDKNQKE
ncbi:MAG: cob(I)yrinic acid a,c-diamide adenosyltransferase [Bacteroidia bacterium]|nr:cob(I)yrinic acid a,c-diamide adenosyltransferase [Bacteroidia bacterium]MDW8157339.1 cob(I)yrinic acid a,c-diamide adenosyltransferase [Bacteroidia bacterium]